MKRNTEKRWIVLISILLLAFLAACGGTTDEPAADDATPTAETNDVVTPVPMDMEDVTEEAGEDETPSEMPQPGIPDPEAFMAEQVSIALAERLDVGVDAVSVESISQTEWPDAALGCPDPEQMYAQVITPGYEITLSVEGETYTYHTDTSGSFVLCGDDGRPAGEVQ